MPKKYNIHTKTMPPRFLPVGKYTTVEFREDCAGSCRECVKKKCVYGIFKENYLHMISMNDPEYIYTCQSCFRCVQECTKGIFSRVINPDFISMGNDYWTPDIIHRTQMQAHTGKVPVSGAGYRGPFVGEGFDSMWTDMSEIVRPTRDGIHGREYINTCIELSRRPVRLRFNPDKTLATKVTPIFDIPLPIIFQEPDFGLLSDNVIISMARAASKIGTMMFIKPEHYLDVLMPYAVNLIPMLTKDNYRDNTLLIKQSRMVELAYEPGIGKEFIELRKLQPGLFISVGITLRPDAAELALELAKTDVDTIHLYADDRGREKDAENPRFIKEILRDVHLKLVENLLRHKINIIVTGGIAMAEHVAKSIICGADGVAVNNSLLIALECRMCSQCINGKPCPVKLDNIELDYATDRIVNLMGAWHNQLLEVMGAMGLREARRLKGEKGRSMWFEDLERESFEPIFGRRKVLGLG